MRASPIIGNNNTIYANVIDHWLYAIDENGNVKWKVYAGGLSTPVIGKDGMIYTGGSHDEFVAISPTGEIKWRYDTEENTIFSPVIGCDGIIYFGNTNGILYAIFPNGTIKWSIFIGISDSPVIYNNTIIVPGNGNLYSISSNGIIQWKFQKEHITGPVVIGIDGTIYARAENNSF
jgi:outer membrane protein assembly factor BamB